jgi:hypothetical protein
MDQRMEMLVLFVALHSPWLVACAAVWSIAITCPVCWKRTHSRVGALWLIPMFITGLLGLGFLEFFSSQAGRFPARYTMNGPGFDRDSVYWETASGAGAA